MNRTHSERPNPKQVNVKEEKKVAAKSKERVIHKELSVESESESQPKPQLPMDATLTDLIGFMDSGQATQVLPRFV